VVVITVVAALRYPQYIRRRTRDILFFRHTKGHNRKRLERIHSVHGIFVLVACNHPHLTYKALCSQHWSLSLTDYSGRRGRDRFGAAVRANSDLHASRRWTVLSEFENREKRAAITCGRPARVWKWRAIRSPYPSFGAMKASRTLGQGMNMEHLMQQCGMQSPTNVEIQYSVPCHACVRPGCPGSV